MKIRTFANAFIIALGFAFALPANALVFSVFNNPTASVGDTIEVGVKLNLGAGETVSAFQFNLNFDPSLMDVVCISSVCGSTGVLNAGSSFFTAFGSSGVVSVADVFPMSGLNDDSIALIQFSLKSPTSGTSFSLSDFTVVDDSLNLTTIWDDLTNTKCADCSANSSTLEIASAVPVPGTAALLGLGLGLLGWMRRRQA